VSVQEPLAIRFAPIIERLETAQRILLTCHRGPDGDSVGSMVALATLLKNAGKHVVLYNPDLVPRHLQWLPLARTFVQQLKKKATFDLTIVLDCGDAKLLGNHFPGADVTGCVVALDHHGKGRPFADVFLCDPTASAVGVMVAQLAKSLDWPLTHDAALGLYVAIVSDTGGFRHANTNPEVLRLAADLVEHAGVVPNAIQESLHRDSTLGRYRLLARLLGDMDVILGGKVAIITITPALLKECKATWDDTLGLINYARSLAGVCCGVLMSPSKYGGIRVSMRARKGLCNVGDLCFALGGGGHAGAAGCTLTGSLEEARSTIEMALTKEFEAQHA